MTIKRNVELLPFNKVKLVATRKSWEHQLASHADDVVASAYLRVLDWTEAHTDYTCENGNGIAYGIFESSHHAALAIVQIAYTKSGKKWLKVLDLDLSPALDVAFFEDKLNFDQIGGIFAEAILGSIKLTKTAHPAKVTKLYGRSSSALAFFKGFGAAFEKFGGESGMDVSIEGRWLVFKAATKTKDHV